MLLAPNINSKTPIIATILAELIRVKMQRIIHFSVRIRFTVRKYPNINKALKEASIKEKVPPALNTDDNTIKNPNNKTAISAISSLKIRFPRINLIR